MDQINHEFLKKLTKFIVLSIWILSLVATQNFYIYRFTIQLVTHAVDKNYMFLLCNGLLVVVAAKSSSLVVSSKPTETNLTSNTDKTFDHRDYQSYDSILELEYNSREEVTVEEDIKHQETEKEEEHEDTLADDNGEEECDLLEEEDIELVRSKEEEMNKKFDEFIRKMKEELRLEAKRHLVLV